MIKKDPVICTREKRVNYRALFGFLKILLSSQEKLRRPSDN